MSGHGQIPDLRLDDLTIAPGSRPARLPIIGLILGLLGIGASVLLAGSHQQAALYSYLVAFLFFGEAFEDFLHFGDVGTGGEAIIEILCCNFLLYREIEHLVGGIEFLHLSIPSIKFTFFSELDLIIR